MKRSNKTINNNGWIAIWIIYCIPNAYIETENWYNFSGSGFLGGGGVYRSNLSVFFDFKTDFEIEVYKEQFFGIVNNEIVLGIYLVSNY